MKRIRPKTIIHNVSDNEKSHFIKKWIKWSNRNIREIGRQLLDYDMYSKYLDIVATSPPSVQNPSAFHDWNFRNYASNATISLRRVADHSSDTQSFWRLLYELIKYPHVITREYHKSLYINVPELAEYSCTNIFGKSRKYLSTRMIRGDLRRIEDSVSRIRRFVNKRVSHMTRDGTIRKLPRYIDILNTLQVIEKSLKKYHSILTAEGYVDLKPTRQYEWMTIFDRPWRVNIEDDDF